jgi:hypothetical protein
LLWTRESESKGAESDLLRLDPGVRVQGGRASSPICFGPGSPSPRRSPNCFGFRSPMDFKSKSKTKWTPCASLQGGKRGRGRRR